MKSRPKWFWHKRTRFFRFHRDHWMSNELCGARGYIEKQSTSFFFVNVFRVCRDHRVRVRIFLRFVIAYFQNKWDISTLLILQKHRGSVRKKSRKRSGLLMFLKCRTLLAGALFQHSPRWAFLLTHSVTNENETISQQQTRTIRRQFRNIASCIWFKFSSTVCMQMSTSLKCIWCWTRPLRRSLRCGTFGSSAHAKIHGFAAESHWKDNSPFSEKVHQEEVAQFFLLHSKGDNCHAAKLFSLSPLFVIPVLSQIHCCNW